MFFESKKKTEPAKECASSNNRIEGVLQTANQFIETQRMDWQRRQFRNRIANRLNTSSN